MLKDRVHIDPVTKGKTEYECQICGVGEEGILYRNSSGVQIAELDRLKPIPLTEEILKKNGFTLTGSGNNDWCLLTDYLTKNNRYNLYVGIHKKTIELYVAPPVYTNEDKTWRKHNEIYLQVCEHNVHTLQQSLRIIGLDDLADNLKI